MSNEGNEKGFNPWIVFVLTAVLVVIAGLMLSNIKERKVEAVRMNMVGADVQPYEPRSEKWAKNYPKQYEGWKATMKGEFKSKHNGSTMVDMLEESPDFVVLWAGYGFSKDYNAPRGHMHAVEDIHNTLRTGGPTKEGDGPMPATCWACKSPDVPRVMEEKGVKEFYKGKWYDKGHEIANPIGCADCHDEETMKLTITRPALVEAFERQGRDIEDATHQEMRSLVCAQCHVEYYFAKEGNHLTFPWDNGFTVEDMEKYYDDINFSDWIHPISKAPMLKAQHPGYEVHMMGIHGQRGVSCADCHMPYKTEGGVKFSDHQIISPLANIQNTCQVCHRQSEGEFMKNVFERQDKILESRQQLEKLLVKAHIEAGFAWDKGAKEEEMKAILQDIRHAQWRWDFAAASHGGSFHAPIEMGRVVASGILKVGEARMKLVRLLNKLGHTGEVPMPDISTKAKAQKYVGWNMEKLEKEKEEFKAKVLPEWKKKTEERESKYQ
ncbi:nitrite reductase, formate-dependent, cytochrome [Lentisphaera araneosa HTCC2155]|uniref:nitrite reductase (cytochrome; ammonia-forming) n=1 Tax=Lentisphaera araneosa HTCC2155 TaxID=313628 RepID=A6DH94_9BACT|nr:ammonia-forming cytochrome c nitrite reductase [Lentisphaera araneosa]EDM28977.1 nitrite reductase, formate-dependent, cytochrome [Lentisphaera araneosa HTCC2155]